MRTVIYWYAFYLMCYKVCTLQQGSFYPISELYTNEIYYLARIITSREAAPFPAVSV